MSHIKKLSIGVYNGPDDYTVDGLPSIDLNLSTEVPFLSLSQAEGVGAITTPTGTTYNLSKKSAADSANLAKATLRVCGMTVENEFLPNTDPAVPNPDYTGLYDRYTTVALLESLITRREMVLVYDAVEGSFFVMPPVYSFADSITPTTCGSHTITMAGYYVGKPQGGRKELRGGSGLLRNQNYTMINKDTQLATTTHVMEMDVYGSNVANFEAAGLMLDANNYIESTRVPIIELVSLGAPSTWLTTSKTNVSKLIKVSGVTYHPFEAGLIEVSDLLIPLYV